MKNIRTLGIITTVFLIIIIGAFAVLAALGIFGEKPEKPDSSGGITIESGASEEKQWNISGKTAVIKTSAGDISIELADCSAAEKFIALENSGAFSGAEFSTLAENMFIQTGIYGEGFVFEENSNPCEKGAVGFVIEENFAYPGIVIITGEDLESELDGKVLVFGKVTSGMDSVLAIASGENSGYTGGFSALEPIAIADIEISE